MKKKTLAMARLGVLLTTFIGTSALSSAVVSKGFELQLQVADDHASLRCVVPVSVSDESGTVLGRANVVFENGVPKDSSITAKGRFDRDVDTDQIRFVSITYPAAQQDSILFTNIALRVGPVYGAVNVLDEVQSPPWNGRARAFHTGTKTNEMDTMFTAVRLQCYVKDSTRPGSGLRPAVQLKNGQIVEATGPDLGSLYKDNSWAHVSIPLPFPIKRSMIHKFILQNGANRYDHVLDGHEASYTPDDVELSDFQIDGIRANGTPQTIYRKVGSLRLEDYSSTDIDLLPRDTPTAFEAFKIGAIKFKVFTGSDDLRWKPDSQPNMEFSVSATLKDGSKVLLLGRPTFPNVKFGDGGIWAGGFQAYSWAEKTLGINGPMAHDIVAIEVEILPGQRTGNAGVTIGREADQWNFKGFYAGCASGLVSGQASWLAGWTTLVSDFDSPRKVKIGDKIVFPVRTTRSAELRAPIKIGN